MRSTAHVHGHPIHPMLIPYPFALLTSGAAFDVAARLTGRRQWARTARHLTTAGVVSALVAAVPGAVDYFGTVPRGRARRWATFHALSNVSGLACFATTLRGRDGELLSDRSLAFALAGTVLLSIGGLLGGELVYRERIGVIEDGEAPRAALPPGWDPSRAAVVAEPGVL